jgi:hypothetical protein
LIHCINEFQFGRRTEDTAEVKKSIYLAAVERNLPVGSDLFKEFPNLEFLVYSLKVEITDIPARVGRYGIV